MLVLSSNHGLNSLGLTVWYERYGTEVIYSLGLTVWYERYGTEVIYSLGLTVWYERYGTEVIYTDNSGNFCLLFTT